MSDFADMEIERGMDEDWPFGPPRRRQRSKLSAAEGAAAWAAARAAAAMEARARACDEIAGVRECEGLGED